jgi:transcriptional antiterminator RfaH
MSEPLQGQPGKKWHVLYVHARHEKRIHSEMLERRIESFLPMKKELHVWSDRRKWVDVPLFSSYVFANITTDERNWIFPLTGFVKFVCSEGKPSIVPQWQIDGIKAIVDSYPEDVEVLDSDYIGMEGVILAGPLAGMHGKIIDMKNRKCFAIKIDGIDKVLSVTLPVSLFRPFPSRVGSGLSGKSLRSAQSGQLSETISRDPR